MLKDKDQALARIENLILGTQRAPAPSSSDLHLSMGNQSPGSKGKIDYRENRNDLGDTSSSLLIIPDEDSQPSNLKSQHEIHQRQDNQTQPSRYRTYVDTSSTQRQFLGESYNISMEETMLQAAVKEKRVWLQCIDRYTNMEPVGTEFDESRMILSETAIVWIKIGNQMVRDTVIALTASGKL